MDQVVPSEDWSKAVDAWPSSPWRQSSSGTGEERSDSPKDGEEDVRTAYVHEKL